MLQTQNHSAGSKAGKARGLKKRLWTNALRTRPWIAFRIIFTWLFLSPWFLVTLVFSSAKASRWTRLKTCRDFMKKHELAFQDIDPSQIKIESLSGGVSNSNHLWRCRRKNGEPVVYFVKVFVPVGTFWAKNLSLVSPFPEIYGISTRERFAVDIVSRVALSERGVAVPRLVAFDAVHQVLVTEFLEGENVDEMLMAIAREGRLTEEAEVMIRECGAGLGRIHRLCYSLIDTQPINCIWSAAERRVYFTDLEFCTQSDKRVWDVGFFMCFLSIRLPEGLKAQAHDIFLKNYEKESGINLKKLDETQARLREYIPVFQTVLDIRQFTPEDLFAELLDPQR